VSEAEAHGTLHQAMNLEPVRGRVDIRDGAVVPHEEQFVGRDEGRDLAGRQRAAVERIERPYQEVRVAFGHLNQVTVSARESGATVLTGPDVGSVAQGVACPQ